MYYVYYIYSCVVICECFINNRFHLKLTLSCWTQETSALYVVVHIHAT